MLVIFIIPYLDIKIDSKPSFRVYFPNIFYYLIPLSYGTPRASGVEVFLENTISAIIVVTNGIE